MRRMILMALGMGLLTAAVGCSCVHGVCDCDRPAPAVLQAEPVAPGGYVAPTSHVEEIGTAPRMLRQ